MSNEYKDYYNDLLKEKAYKFAYKKHFSQKRKFTGEQYINHPMRVQEILFKHMVIPETLDFLDDMKITEMSCICFLHDVLEDTETTYEELKNEFGEYIASSVQWLTNVSKPEDGNREQRKKKDLHHILEAPLEAICVKVADVIDNCRNIVKAEYDYLKTGWFPIYQHTMFSTRYLKEKQIFVDEVEKLIETRFTDKDLLTQKWLLVLKSLLKECKTVIGDNQKQLEQFL